VGSGAGLEGIKLDALRVVTNIGARHAASALSQIMSGCRVMITVPDVKVVPSDVFSELFRNPDAVIVVVWMRIFGDLTGRAALVMPGESAKLLCDLMLGRAPGTTTEFGELEHSTLAEAGSILGSAYLNALADFLDRMLLPSVPTVVIAKPDDLAVQLHIDPEQTVFCASTAFAFPDADLAQTLEGQFLHLPEPSSVEALFKAIAG
jgi:chemotaxis protein CheC